MGRPDYGRVQRQQRALGDFVGETATWYVYVSASAGNPAYGVGPEPIYQARTVTGLLKPAAFEEVQAVGGQFYAGDMLATLLDCQPGPKDEILYRGVTYRVASDTWPQPLIAGGAYRMVLRRGDATG